MADFSLSKWMNDIGDFGDKAVLDQWAVDLLKSELKLSNYMLDPMCQRTQYNAGNGNWNLAGINLWFLISKIYIRKLVLNISIYLNT